MEAVSILENINRHILLSDEEAFYFNGLLTEKKIKKKDCILLQGKPCREIYFVESGLLRAFHPDVNQKESTIMFATADWWITDMYCFLNQLPALLTIEAAQASSILCLRKTDLDQLYIRVPAFERFFRILFQHAYVREQLRVIENLSLTAYERYNRFVSKYPQVLRQVTQKQIASYLGVTPEFLSTIRSHKLKG